MVEKNELKKYLRKKTSLKNMLMCNSFKNNLQYLADSSLLYFGFSKIPIRLIWDNSEDASIACINDKECIINLDSVLDQNLSYIQRKKLAFGKLTHEVFGHGLYTDFKTRNSLLDNLQAGIFSLEKYFQMTGNYNLDLLNQINSYYKEIPDLFIKLFFSIENIVEDPTIEYLGTQKYPGFKKHVDFLKSLLIKRLLSIASNSLDDIDIIDALLMQARNCITDTIINKFPSLKKTEIVFDNIENYSVYTDRIVAACYIVNAIWSTDLKPIFDEAKKDQEALEKILNMLREFSKISPENNQRTKDGEGNKKEQDSKRNSPLNSNSIIVPMNVNKTKNEQPKNNTSDLNDAQHKKQEDKSKDKKSGECNSNNKKSSNELSSNTENNNSLNVENDDLSSDVNNNSDNKINDLENTNIKNVPEFIHSDNEKNTHSSNNDNDVFPDALLKNIDKILEETSADFIDRMIVELLNNKDNSIEKEYENNLVQNNVYKNNFHKDYPFRIHKITSSNKTLYNSICDNKLKSIARNLSNKIIKAVRTRQKTNILYEQDEGQMLDINAYANASDKCFMSINQPNKKPVMACTVMIDQSASMNGNRCRAAINAAVVIERFCRDLNIPIHIYGHNDTANCVQIYNYIEHFDTPTQNRAYKLANIKLDGCNRDGFAIRYGLLKLLKRNEPTRVMFIISDGAPNSKGYGTNQAIKDVVDIKKICKQKKITLIALAIGNDIEKLEKIYGSSLVDARNLNDLPKNLTSILLKKMKRLL